METLVYFLICGALIFFMMRFGCGAHVMGHGHGHHHSDAPARGDGFRGGRNIGGVPPANDVDPVCGMTVDTATAKSAVHGGRAYYFCSAECREKFETAPANYVTSAGAASPQMEHHHVH